MLYEEKDREAYNALPPYIRLFIRIIIFQVRILYHLLKRFDMMPEFQVVTYEYYLEKMGIMLKDAFKDMEEDDLPPVIEEEDKDKEPPLQ